MSNFGRNLALWVIIALLLVVLFNLFQPGTTHNAATQVAYSDFISEVNGGRVRDVVIQGHTISGQLSDGRTFQTYTPEDPSLVKTLTDKNVRVIAKPEDSDVNPLLHYLLSWFPMLLLIGVWVFFMRQMQAGGGRAMGFGKSRARMLTEKQGRVTFDDVAGIDEAKGELQEIVEFLKDPQKFQRLGGKIPKGVLLVGPPGTGKTLLARAIAGEANVPFFTISGSDFVEMFVGVGAVAGARHVRARQEERALHHLHRRNRRRRAASRRRPGRRQRRARADAEPDAGGDGRLRVQRGRHPDRGDQPAGRAGSGAAAARPLRPPGGGAQPRRERAREDPAGSHAQGAAGVRRRSEGDRARHAGLLGCRPGEPGERGGAAGGSAGQARRCDERVRGRQGQGADGHRAALAGDVRGGEADDRLPRGRPCAVRHARAGMRSGAQGDDHSRAAGRSGW